MAEILEDIFTDTRVHVACMGNGAFTYHLPCGDFSSASDDTEPIKAMYSCNEVKLLVARLFEETGWDGAHANTPTWNPLGELFRPGDTVVLKPNWVYHENSSGHGIDCLVTHASVLGAVLDMVLRGNPGKVVVGDAPIQGCDLLKLMDATGYSALKRHYAQLGAPVGWMDFRRTVLANPEGVWDRQTNVRPFDEYVVFDLGSDSLLEPISMDAQRFRVTMYDPNLMRLTHAPGRHQYLLSREVVEADVVINLPKLKTHKKSCLTGALKNLVGINGNKDYLPHHRLGGSESGGDCYPGRNRFKLATEHLLDVANRQDGWPAFLLRQASLGSYALSRLTGGDRNLEGSWYGNDTIWRTCLDLNRILLYGRPDGTLSELPQRKVLTITDAVVCGEGEGPLAPIPRTLGVLTLAMNPVAAEYFHAHLMGFDWRKIPLVREAFADFRFPLCRFSPGDVEVRSGGRRFLQPWPPWGGEAFVPPRGWKGHCERQAEKHTSRA